MIVSKETLKISKYEFRHVNSNCSAPKDAIYFIKTPILCMRETEVFVTVLCTIGLHIFMFFIKFFKAAGVNKKSEIV